MSPPCAGRWTAWRWPSNWPPPATRRSDWTVSKAPSTNGSASSSAERAIADRHRSLRDAIDWSYELLDPEDRVLLNDVSVLASWFDVDAARAVSGPNAERATIADGLARLAGDSLLVVQRGEPTRYRALETIRQYGVEQLAAAGELGAIRARHEHWCRAEMHALRSAAPDDAWCAQFDRVVDDIRAALLWSAADEQRRSESASLAADLAGLLFVRGRPAEAQRRYEQAAELTPIDALRAAYLRLAAGAAASRYVGNEALRLLGAAADLATTLGDASRGRSRPGVDGDLHHPGPRDHGRQADRRRGG